MNEVIYNRCLRFARKVLPPDPALEPGDLVNSAWIKVGARLDSSRSEGEQAGYLCLIIGQIAIDHRRRLQRAAPCIPLEDWQGVSRGVEGEVLDRLTFAATIATVPPALVLWACGWPWAEIAQATGVERVTLQTRAHRWRRAQQEVMA